MLEKIRDILLEHRGKSNKITSAQIADLLGIDEDDTHSQTRSLILACAKKYNLPLAGNRRGYFLMEDEQELESYMNNLNSRISGIEKRKEIISDNFKRWNK